MACRWVLGGVCLLGASGASADVAHMCWKDDWFVADRPGEWHVKLNHAGWTVLEGVLLDDRGTFHALVETPACETAEQCPNGFWPMQLYAVRFVHQTPVRNRVGTLHACP